MLPLAVGGRESPRGCLFCCLQGDAVEVTASQAPWWRKPWVWLGWASFSFLQKSLTQMKFDPNNSPGLCSPPASERQRREGSSAGELQLKHCQGWRIIGPQGAWEQFQSKLQIFVLYMHRVIRREEREKF